MEDLTGLDLIKQTEEGEEEEEESDPNQGLILKSSFSTQIEIQERWEWALIIDGDYFEIGIKELERLNSNKQLLSVPKNIHRLFDFIKTSTQMKSIDWKSFHTAEEPKSKKRKGYYSVLEELGFNFDIREFKSKKVKCPNTNCQHYK
jgi:hypothetical protein